MTIFWIVVVVFIVLVTGFRLFMRSHRRWLEKQSPVGVWQAASSDSTITIEFEGGPHEGIYKQLIELDGKEEREFGHWACHLHALQMLIMASDRQNHPRFGDDTTYEIRYVGFDRIEIDGPDRPRINYQRAPEGTTVDIEPEEVT